MEDSVIHQDAYDNYNPVFENNTYAFSANREYVSDPYMGFRLRSLKKFIGDKLILKTNSLGLRCDDINKTPKEKDVAVFLGGSVIFGSYAPSDQETISSLCESNLKHQIHCVNAGANGHVLTQHVSLYTNYITPYLKPKYVILYAGYNDFLLCCRYKKSFGRLIIEDFQDILANYPQKPFKTALIILTKGLKFKIHKIKSLLKKNQPSVAKKDNLPLDALGGEAHIQNYINQFVNHIELLSHLCSSTGTQFLFFLQPALALSGKIKTELEKNLESSITEAEALAFFYKALKKELHQKSYFKDHSDIFLQEQKSIFVDPCHLGDRGNKIIAHEISSIIGGVLPK